MDKNKVIQLLKYKNIEVIGSSTDKNIKYPSDIDLQDISEVSGTYDDIYNFFKNIYDKSKENTNIFIIDFKCGTYRGKPIKWTQNDIKKGYKVKGDFKIPFVYALSHENSMIKMDVIAIGKDQIFCEYSVNYYFHFTKYNHSNFVTNKELIFNRLMYDYYQLMNNEHIYKAMKRAYSITKMANNKKGIKTLTKLFNSHLGLLYKQKSSLETILNVITNNFRKPDKDIIKYNLNIVKSNLPKEYQNTIQKIISLERIKSMEKYIDSLISDISKEINDESIKWINDNFKNK